jgi:hypothetical protein
MEVGSFRFWQSRTLCWLLFTAFIILAAGFALEAALEARLDACVIPATLFSVAVIFSILAVRAPKKARMP